MAEVKKKFVPNREAELKQSARVSQEKKKADANVQNWTKKTGSTKNLIKEYGATKANYSRLNKRKKWYSGDKPTERETVAEMYRVSGGDGARFSELEQMYKQEQRTIGSPIYNPYAEATNWKAIEGLTELGFDLSGGVTSEWLQQNQGLLNGAKTTTAGYSPSSPGKYGSDAEWGAYWFKELQEAEERTVAAETEYSALANEVKYWADCGYSDDAILNKVRGHFDSDYKTLSKMDEDRLAGSATLLNRKVNYSGDDTIYGMIWAARNDGGSGDYFVDSVQHALGTGKKYKSDPNSEAARDPSNAEGYHPYIGSNTHEMNMKYGVDSVDMDWLEANRSMLNDPEQADDWRTLHAAVENADAATEQLAALDQWLEQQVEKGTAADAIVAKLETLINDGGELRYTNADGERATIKLSTLSGMEEKRQLGAYMDLGYGVDFTLPSYIEKANDMVAERDAAAEAAKAEESEKEPFWSGVAEDVSGWLKNAGEEVGRFVASFGLDGIGSYGDDVDAFLGAQKGKMTENDIARKYASDVLGIEITGDLTDEEKALINDAMAKVDVSIQPRSSDEERAAASAAIEAVDTMLRGVAEDPNRRYNYMADEAYTSVYEKQPEEPREGMQEFTADPVAYTVAPMPEGQAGPVYEIPESGAYKGMLQGGEWDGNAILWAYNESNNPIAIEATLVEGILNKMRGEDSNGLGTSWYDAHKDLIANINPDLVHGALGREELEAYRQKPELRDSRRAYGSEVYDALMANQEALDEGAIEDEQYARNLIGISFVVDAIKASSDNGKITDEQASAVIAGDASLQEFLAGATASAAAGMDAVRKDEEEAQKKLIEVMDNYASGAELDMDESMVVQSVLSMDVSKVAKADAAYQDTLGYFDDYVAENLSVDALMQDGVSFSYGNEADMDFDYLQLQQSGAAVYSRGVKDIATEKLDREMRMAAAYGMTLDEYYEAYPERARSGEQLIAEARTEYDTAWNDFGNTLYGLEELDASMKAEDEEQATKGEDILGPRDIIAFVIDKWSRSMDLNLAKTGNFLLYSGEKDQKVSYLREQYGNTPEAFASDLNEWEKGELSRLQETYNYDSGKEEGQSFEDWLTTHPAASYYREIKAQREANPDIFNIGMTVDEIKSNQTIYNQTRNIANIDKVVAENGSEVDNLAYGVGASLMNSGTVMAATAVGGGGLIASMAASAPEYLASGYDRYKETGNYNAALLASAGEIVVNGLIEKVGYDRYVPDNVAGMLDNKVAHSKYILSHKGLAHLIKQPKAMSKVASGVMSGIVKGAMDSASEFMEEFSQAVVSAIADNTVYGEPILPSAEQLSDAAREGVMAFFTGPIFSMVSGSGISFSDDAGNALDAAKAQLLPEHDGAIINDAIEYQTAVVAINNSQDALAQIEASSENAAKQQAQADLKVAETELADAQTELATAESEYQAAAVALEDVNTEMQDSDVFTEDMQKRMSSAADAMRNARKRTEAAKKGWEKARTAQQEAKQRLADAQAKVQAMYNDVMGRAKAEAEQAITDMFFGGDSEAQQAAMKVYRDACARLMDAKNRLRSAKADAEMYARTPRGDDAQSAYGETLLEIDTLTEEVAAAKAEVEAAYVETGEGMMEAKQNEELIAAEESANAAAEAAAADPMNIRNQQKAELEQAKLRTIRAKYDMEEKRSGISKRLQDPRNSVREEAVKEWNAIQGEANAAAAESEALQAEFDKTDAQKNLRTAIENMQQYSNDDLMDESSPNHEAAMDAYSELQAASEDAEFEQALTWLSKAMKSPENAGDITNAARRIDELRSRKTESPAVSTPVKHIDDRTLIDVSDKSMQPFFNSNRDSFKDYALAVAKIIRGDVHNSTAAQRIFVAGGAGNGRGSDQLVLGQARLTTDLIGKYMDISKWSWKRMGDYLDRFINALETDKPLPNTAYIKRIELMINEALTDGYTDIAGIRMPPAYNYIAGKAAIDGRAYADTDYENSDGESFYDMTGAGSPITPRLVEAAKDISAAVRTHDGRYVLEVGNKFVYTDGNTENPQISEVVTLTVPDVNSDLKLLLKETVYHAYDEGVHTDGVWETLHSIFESDTGIRDSVRRYDARIPEADNRRPGGTAGISAGGTSGEGSRGVSDESKIQAWRDTGAGRGDHRTPGRTGEVTTADRNPIEILSDLTRSIGVGYNPGGEMSMNGRRLPRAVQGFYNRYARSISTRTSEAGDLEIGLHEFGHAVQQRLPNLHANQQLLNGLSQDVRDAYDPAEWDGEAIAEFVVDYIFNRDEAVRQAGQQFVQDFETMLEQDIPLRDAIRNASHQTVLWNNADVGSKIGSMTKDSIDPRRGQIGNWLSRTIRNVETAVFDFTAPADLVSRDFRQRALYAQHAGNRADVSLTRFLIDPNGRNIGQSLAERLFRAGVTEADQRAVNDYALARHALDRRRQNRDVFDPHEFTTDALERYVADVEANHPNIVAGADAITSYWNDFMDAWWVETGMIDRADVDAMRAMYPHYVPTFRVMEKNFNQFGGKSSRFRVRGAVEGGSSLEVINPIASIVKMTQQMVNTVTQNQLMQAFHNEWRRGGLGFLADDVTEEMRAQRTNTNALQTTLDAINATGVVDPALMNDAYAEMLNLQERWYGTGQNYGANVVSGVDEYGNRFFYRIKGDKGLFDLLSGNATRSRDMGAALRTVRNFKHTFTKLTTGSNPLFAVKNAMRDIQASVNTGTHSLTYADGMVRWLGALYEVMTNSDTYQDWVAMGGGEHTRLNVGIDGRNDGQMARELGRALFRGRTTRGGDFRTRSTAGERLMNTFTWEKFNNAIENASRFVEYRYGRHDLTTDEGRMEAFMRSQDVTTNFGTRGSGILIRIANNAVPFMNATLQGLNKDAHIIRDVFSRDANRRRQAAPKAAKIVMNTALTAALQYAILKMFGGNEDDEDYALLNDEMRAGNLIIPIPKGAMDALGDAVGFDKPYIRIPIAQGPLSQGAYATMLDAVSNVADYSPMEIDLWKVAKSLLADSIPDGTVLQGIIDASNNRTWYGGEIESEYMRQYSTMNRYDSDTPDMVVGAARWTGNSPAKLDYLLNQYTGFAGKILMPFISADRFDPDADWSLGSAVQNVAYSVLKNYTIDPVSSNDLSNSYSNAKETVSQIIADGKAGKPMGNVAFNADPDEAYGAAQYLSEEFAVLDKEISAAWADYNAIKDSNLSDGEKARRMRAIRRDSIVPLQQDAMALYEEFKMQYIDNDWLALAIAGDIPFGLDRPILD